MALEGRETRLGQNIKKQTNHNTHMYVYHGVNDFSIKPHQQTHSASMLEVWKNETNQNIQ